MREGAKPGRRAQQKSARQCAILAAAEHALGADDDATVEMIAAGAGLAKGTVYNYFPDKVSLVEAVTRGVEARRLSEIAKALAIVRPQARLALLLCGLLKTAIDDQSGAAILCRRMEEDGAASSAIGRAIFAELRAGGFCSAMSGEELSAALVLVLATMRAALTQIANMPNARQQRRVAAFVVLCMRAVGAGSEASESAVKVAMDHLGMAQKHPTTLECARLPLAH